MEGLLLDGRYRFVSRTGVGGMGEVWRCRDERMGRDVAVKLLSHTAYSDERLGRFDREARIVAGLASPAIVAVHDFGRAEVTGRTVPFLVMELLLGTSLKERLATGIPIPVRDVVAWGATICDALRHAHARGVVHRDIKPANVFLCADGSVKLLDFGIARFVETAPRRTPPTVPGTILGTPHYLSPEQASGGRVDHRGDLYSLGCLLYALLEGKPPFDADSFQALAMRHLTAVPDPPGRTRPDVPRALRELILQMLAKRPSDRPQTAGEVRNRLVGTELVGTELVGTELVGTESASASTALREITPQDVTDDGSTTLEPSVAETTFNRPSARPDAVVTPPVWGRRSRGKSVLLGTVAAITVAALALTTAVLWPSPSSAQNVTNNGSNTHGRGGASAPPAVSGSPAGAALPSTDDDAAGADTAVPLMAQIRATDPCAVLDRVYPKRFGSVAVETTRQAEPFNECQIVASNGGPTDLSVRFRVDLGVPLSAGDRVPLIRASISGVQVFERLAASADNNCTVYLPFGNTGFGTAVEDNRYYPNQGSDQPPWPDACVTAEGYAAVIAPAVAALTPMAAAPTGHTLVGRDPCNAVDGQNLGVPGWSISAFLLPGPYQCTIKLVNGDTAYDLELDFTRDAEQSAPGAQPISVDGINGIELVGDPPSSSCIASLVYVHQTTAQAWDAQLIEADASVDYGDFASPPTHTLDTCTLVDSTLKLVVDDLP